MAKRARILLIGLLLFLLLFQNIPHGARATVNPTNIGLVEFAQKALQENWGYVYGTYGQVISQSVLSGKIQQYPSQFAEIKKDGRTVAAHAQKWLGVRAADCVGLAKAYLWWQNDTLGPKYSSATDFSADGLYARSQVNGPLANMPDTHGLMLWRNGHVGIYIGNDEVIEARGVEYGVVKTRLADRNWTRWFIHPDLAYVGQGWVTIGPDQYYYRAGQYVTGEQTIDNRLYLFASDGKRLSGMQVVGGSTVYYPGNGLTKSGWQTIEGNRYYLDERSRPLTGWQELGGKSYYFDAAGVLLTGWQLIDGQLYQLAETGQPVTGLQEISGQVYRFAADGRLLDGFLAADGLYYTDTGRSLLDEAGKSLTGWQDVAGERIWFDLQSGLAGGPGLVEAQGQTILLDRSGRPAGENGLFRSGAAWYYLAGQGQPLAGEQSVPAYTAQGGQIQLGLSFSSTDFSLQLPGLSGLQPAVSLAQGQAVSLLADPGQDPTGRVWFSLDPAVATVDKQGILTGHAAGRTLAGFSQEDNFYLSEVAVYSDSAAQSGQTWPDELMPGTGAPWPLPGIGPDLDGLYQLTSSDNTVVAVLPTGQLAAKKSGTAVLSLWRDGQKITEQSILVGQPVVGISCTRQTLNLNLAQIQASPFRLLPENKNGLLHFSSSQPDVASVDENGNIKGHKAGQAVITASYQGLSSSVVVSVKGSLPLLARGSAGESVQKLQEHLYALGYLAKKPDSSFTSTDEFAVRSLEVKMLRPQTGAADSNLQKLLYDNLAGPASKNLSQSSLVQGNSGEQVLVLQQRLEELHIFKLEPNGLYDEHTVQAVRLFQQLNQLQVNGAAGPAEISQLFKTGVVAANSAPYAGATGPEVLLLQERLKELGFYAGSLDGIFSSSLTISVRVFQQKAGLTVDGKAGPLTNRILFAKDAPRHTTPEEPAPTPSPEPTPTPKPEPTPSPGPSDSSVPLPSSLKITLSRGSKSEDVRRLQLRLNELGFAAGTADGSFGPNTEKAVLAYQKSAGLAVDGKAGPQTLTSLFGQGAAPAPTPEPEPEPEPEPPPETGAGSGSVLLPSSLKITLSRGSKSEDVRRLQLRLNELGFAAGTADGSFGPNTEKAVLAYQKSAGLAVDGKAGPQTLTSLFGQAAATPEPEPVPEPEAGPDPAPETGAGSGSVLLPSTLKLTLSRGSQSEDVRRLQLHLNTLGFAAGTADGSFGPNTEKAVLAYQRSAGLAVDGKAGPQTLASLFGQAAPAPGTGPGSAGNLDNVLLRRGSSGEAVRRLQQRLVDLGYVVGPVDGSFGAKTEKAVMDFQKNAALVVDGIFGPKSVAALNKEDAPTA